jgi:hypothetical protein
MKAAKRKGIIGRELKVINVGIPSLADDIESQEVKVVRVDWEPPARGGKETLKIPEDPRH